MSRSGYDEDGDFDNWAMIRWRGAVERAILGQRGQAFFKALAEALDAMPEKRLIAEQLEERGEVCALGALGRRRGIDMTKLDPERPKQVGAAFDIAPALARETAYINDEGGPISYDESPEARWRRVRAWVELQIYKEPPDGRTS